MEKTNQIFLANLEKRLAEMGWRIPDLAKATGLSASGLYSITSGRSFPSPDNIDRIATALGRPIWWLFSSGEPVKPTIDEAVATLLRALEEAKKTAENPLVKKLLALPEDRLKLIEEAISQPSNVVQMMPERLKKVVKSLPDDAELLGMLAEADKLDWNAVKDLMRDRSEARAKLLEKRARAHLKNSGSE